MILFAHTCEKLSKESSTLKKVEVIADAISGIKDDNELYLFCLYLTGAVFPSSIQKTINVGKAWVRDATIKLLGITLEQWQNVYNRKGEVSETVEELMESEKLRIFDEGLLQRKTTEEDKEVSLEDFKEFIESLNQNSKSSVKIDLISEFFSTLTPIEAKYAAKLLMQKMRIGVQEPTVEDGIAKAFSVEKAEVKKLNFYLGDIGEVAQRCKDKNFEGVQFRLFHPIRAMLASAEVDIDEIFNRMGSNVWVEYKYDGIRAHIHADNERVEIYTRDLKRITDQFPEVAESIKLFMNGTHLNIDNDKLLLHSILIDGEIVPYREGKIQAFADLQKRLGRKEKIDEAVSENPTCFVAYDFLYLNGEMLFDKPLKERRNLMIENFAQTLMYSAQNIVHSKEEFSLFFVQSKTEGREGLMVKNPESKYESGKRGVHWLKYKQTLDPLDVVVLKAEFGEGKNSQYLSTFTFGVWDEKHENLIPVGRVYSGMKESDLKYFTDYFPSIATEKLSRGFEVQPEVIFEVGFENIQKSNRYTSGFAVRFPRILRIRTGDKPLEEISTIEDVKRGWQKLNV